MNTSAHEVSARRLSVGMLVGAFGRFFSILLGALVAAVLSRSLSVGDFGTLQMMLGLAAAGVNVVNFGAAQVAVREMAAQPDREPSIAASLLVLSTVAGAGFGAVLLGIAYFAIDTASGRLAAAAIIATLLLGGVTSLATVAQARLRPFIPTVLILFQSVVWLALVGLMAVADAGLWGYGVGFFVASTAHAAATAVVCRHMTSIRMAGAWSEAVGLLRRSWELTVVALFVMAYYRFDSVLVEVLAGPNENGLYQAAYRLFDVLQFIPQTALFVTVPLIAKFLAMPHHQHRARETFQLCLRMVPAAAGTMAVVGVFLAPWLIEVLYGSRYADATILLRILLGGFPAVFLSWVAVGVAVSMRCYRPYLVVSVAAAVVSLGADVVFVGNHGAVAAALVTVTVEWVVAVAMSVVACRSLDSAFPLGTWIRAGAVFGLVLAAGAAASPIHPVVAGLAAAIACASGLVATRIVTMSDLRLALRTETLAPTPGASS